MSGSTQSEGSISMATSDLTISWTMVGKSSPSTSSKMHPVRWGGGRGEGRGEGRGRGRGRGEEEGRGEGTPHQSHKCTLSVCTCTLNPHTPALLSPSHPHHPPTLTSSSPQSSVFLSAARLWKVRAEMWGRPHPPPSTSSSNFIHLMTPRKKNNHTVLVLRW